MDAIELLPLPGLLLQHRCQVTVSLGRAPALGPELSRTPLGSTGGEHCFLLHSGCRVGWLGSSQKQNTLPESNEALYIIQQSPPEVAIIAT